MLRFCCNKLRFNRNIRDSSVISVLEKRNSSSHSKQHVIRSKIPDINSPNQLLDEYLWDRLDKWHDRTIVECADTGRSYTYLQIYKKSGALANFLHKSSGLKQGDTIAIILPNVPEFPILLLGAIQAGMKTTIINPSYTPGEIATQLKDSETKLVFTLASLWHKTIQAIQSLNCKKLPVIVLDVLQNESMPMGAIKFTDTIKGDHNISFKIPRTADDVIIIPYSSGTTGLPKGVKLTNKSIVANMSQLSVREFGHIYNADETRQDVEPAILPMFHIFGLVPILFVMMAHGAKLVTIPKFDSQIFIDVLQKHKPNIVHLVPPLVMLMIDHPKIRPDHISRLQTIISGAAPLGSSDIERLRQKSKNKLNVIQGYGMTETSAVAFFQTKMLPNGIKPGGVGFCLPSTECKIASIDNKNELLGPNQPGELFLRGPQIMKGYLNNIKASNETLDADGWLRTGDVVYYDEDEHFFITGRVKELIKVSGFQVAPAELEELLREHPDVEDVAVVGIPHTIFGEVPKAFVIRRKDSTIESTTIQEYIAAKVAKFKQLIGGVVFVDSIPKTPSGKILKRVLKDM